MLFFSFFKTLVNHEVTVELKNDISIRGTLKSVDQYLNIKLDDIQVVEELKYPHLVSKMHELDSRKKISHACACWEVSWAWTWIRDADDCARRAQSRMSSYEAV